MKKPTPNIDTEDVLETALYAVPIASVVYSQCKRAGIAPLLPVLGLLVGIVVEVNR